MCIQDHSIIHTPIHFKIHVRLFCRNIASTTKLRLLSFSENKGRKVKLIRASGVKMKLAAALKEEFEVLFEVWYLDSWGRQSCGQSALGGKRKPILATVILTTAAAAAAKSLQSCPTPVTPLTTAHQAPPSMGFSRQEYWSGVILTTNGP